MDFIWNKGSVDGLNQKNLKAKHRSAVIPVFGEAEAGGSSVQSQLGLYTETLSQKEEGREGGKKKVRKKGRRRKIFNPFDSQMVQAEWTTPHTFFFHKSLCKHV